MEEEKDDSNCRLDWDDAECRKGGFLLVGKIVSTKQVNVMAFKKLIVKIWNPKKRIEISDSEENSFVAAVENKGGKPSS